MANSIPGSLPYTDTKPVGSADFYFAINSPFRFILHRLGRDGWIRYLTDLGTGCYAPVNTQWRQGGLPAVAAYWRVFFAAELGGEVEVKELPDRRRVACEGLPVDQASPGPRAGMWLGHRHIPVQSAGSYVPGDRYPMFGSAQRSIIPAKVAGVKSVVACTPPVKVSGYCPATINAMKQAGADRICVLGGVHAMALMAFGMGEIERVDILCGAGNKFVAGAKRQLFGRCGIDLLAGTNRIAVIADDSADPALVACDLLGQAEHDPASGQPCVCLSATFGRAVREKIARQRPKLPTGEIAGQSWQAIGNLTVAADREEAIRISDAYAPEHLELHVRKPNHYFERPRNYGSLFIGEETTVAYGEKSIGTNRILLTSRSPRYTGARWVGKFLKTVTYPRMTPAQSRLVGAVTARQCDVERMAAHAITARVRVARYGAKPRGRKKKKL